MIRIIFLTAVVIFSACPFAPTGNAAAADIKLTKKLKETGLMLDTPVLDHLIIGEKDYYSFADEKIL